MSDPLDKIVELLEKGDEESVKEVEGLLKNPELRKAINIIYKIYERSSKLLESQYPGLITYFENPGKYIWLKEVLEEQENLKESEITKDKMPLYILGQRV